MINSNGYLKYHTWEHSSNVKELYARRCRREVEEQTCAAQAAELLAPHIAPGDSLLDVGCGSGYFYHSLKSRDIPADYYGIDSAPALIRIGQQIMPEFGLPAENLMVMRIEDLDGEVDHVLCMNVLSNMDNYHRPLERILKTARKTVVLRESCKKDAEYLYVRDDYLDDDVDLKVHINAYDIFELMAFIQSYGYRVQSVVDRRSGGKPEMVIDYPHYWTLFVAERQVQP